MSSVASVVAQWQQVLVEIAASLERSSGFVRRRSKLDGPHFVQVLVFGWMANPRASLAELAQMAARVGVRVSAQGLAQRFSPAAAHYLRQVLEAAVAHTVVRAAPVAVPLLRRFAQVWIADSTTVSLPAALAEEWAGCGGGHAPGQGSAALKLQVRLEALSGALDGPLLQDGRAHDGRAPWQFAALPPGSLRLVDLGYSCLERLAAWSREATYWLLRLEVQTAVFDARSGRRLDDLARWLRRHAPAGAGAALDVRVELGVHARVPARLLAVRVARAEAARRRAAIRQEAKRHAQPLSSARLDRAGWDLYITNVEPERLSLAEGLTLGHLRWQIELLFKLWKEHGALDEWRSAQPWRILAEVYAKLLALLLQHGLLLLGCWQQPDRSLRRAARAVQAEASHLARVCTRPRRLRAALQELAATLALTPRIAKRRKAPATYQRLLATDQETLG
jgi:hypothetical protein